MAARKAGQGSSWIRKDKRLAIYLRDGCACAYCGAGIEDGAALTLDHILACELGGDNSERNLVTACLSCNSAKRDMPLTGWFAALTAKGINTDNLGTNLRGLTSRNLRPYRKQAKALLNTRRTSGPVTNALAAA